MDVVREDVKRLVMKELQAANEKFPLFSSSHEGYAVILEELEEIYDEETRLEPGIHGLWCSVKGDDPDGCKRYCNQIYKSAINTAVEAIQTAAMAEKFMDSMKGIKRVQS